MIEVILNTDELNKKSREELYEIIKGLISHIEDEHMGVGLEYVPDVATEIRDGSYINNQQNTPRLIEDFSYKGELYVY